jgi:hypothetical protein
MVTVFATGSGHLTPGEFKRTSSSINHSELAASQVIRVPKNASRSGTIMKLNHPAVLMILAFPASSSLWAAPPGVTFSQPASQVDRFDYVEILASVASPDARNCFTDASLTGSLETADGAHHWTVEGFCDATDASVFRIRFMPSVAGRYKYSVTYQQDGFTRSTSGQFLAVEAHRRGILGVDPQYPWHFIWQGTGEHYFFNGTTAYWLVGWRDDHVIQFSVDRLHRLKVNRMRVTLAGREDVTFFGEPVMTGPNFTVYTAAWPAQNADDPLHPGFDYTRYNLSYWQRFERMLKFARDRDMIISVVLDMNDSKLHPEAGSEDERRFIRYAIDRFGAFSNITWDLGDDLDSYRDERWTHDTGIYLQERDPWKHLETSHPAVSNAHQDRAASWFGFTSYQDWSRDQHDSSDTLRRTAWEIVMAGAYQTSGETVRRGTNVGADMGGGWFNGRGDDTMTMFLGYGHMVDFFTGFEWWKTNPHDELVNEGNYCLADPGQTYAIYLPKGGQVTLKLEPGRYRAHWFSAVTGEKIDLPPVDGSSWTSPAAPDANDWAILLERVSGATGQKTGLSGSH